MSTRTQPRPFAVWLLIALQFFLGLGALAGGACFILAPDGSIMHMPVSMISGSPFSSFLIPGIILFTVVGIYPVMVAYSLWQKPTWVWPNAINPFKQTHWSWAGSLAAGVIVLIWITVEVQFTGVGVLHFVYWAWGIVLIVLTLLPDVRKYYRLKA